jgi:epoxyqueuosine reductase QueG
MDKATLENMALTHFKNLNVARAALFSAAEKAIFLGMELDKEKAVAVASGKFDGKNEETRKAQAREFFASQYTELAKVENSERRAKFDFEQAQTDVDTVKTLLRIAELAE